MNYKERFWRKEKIRFNIEMIKILCSFLLIISTDIFSLIISLQFSPELLIITFLGKIMITVSFILLVFRYSETMFNELKD